MPTSYTTYSWANNIPKIESIVIGSSEWKFVCADKKPDICDVIFNDPATIVKWNDGTKTVVKCQDGDTYSKEVGLAMCIAKKWYGNKGKYNDVFAKWCE